MFIVEKIDSRVTRISTDDGEKYYYNDKLHRLDGPAVSYYEFNVINGTLNIMFVWWYNGEKITCASQQEFEHLLKLKCFW